MLFYASLHLVQAFLSQKGARLLSHQNRDAEIQNNGTISLIFRDYRWLKDKSRAARYEIAGFSEQDVLKARERYEKIAEHMYPLIHTR